MNYFISDLHLGHENIIKLTKRPFATIEEMNEVLINNWNKVVKEEDDVYIIGDLFYKSKDNIEDILSKLKGNKYLILGNHDKEWIDTIDHKKYFKVVTELLTFDDGQRKVTLCHYPMVSFEGRFHIHGHIHGNVNDVFWDTLKKMDKVLNASVEINNFKPVTFDELLINNRKHKANN